MSDIYEPPKARLEHEAESSDNFGSIEEGLRGEYRFQIFEVLGEAWEKTSGAKGTILLAFVVLSLIMFVSMIPLGIGLIWTIPMSMIAYGIIYRNMFGIRNETLSD